MKNTLLILFGALLITLSACKKDKKTTDDKKEKYDTTDLLKNFSNNIIVPRYSALNAALKTLESSFNDFSITNSEEKLNILRTNFKVAYSQWQACSSFEFGPAEDNILRSSMNSYPTNINKIINNINSGIYDLSTAENITASGFPALDYLLFKQDAASSITFFNNNPKDLAYVGDIIKQLKKSLSTVIKEWDTSYNTTFNKLTGTDRGSSFGLIVNAFNLEFEKYIRDGKVGIPVGKRSLGNAQPNKTEAYYSKHSIKLLESSINNLQNYFNGKGETTGSDGFDDFLDHVEAKKNNELLSNVINNQFETIKAKIKGLNNLSEDVINKQQDVNMLYKELQKMLVLIKIDMPSALTVLITYEDSDGD